MRSNEIDTTGSTFTFGEIEVEVGEKRGGGGGMGILGTLG